MAGDTPISLAGNLVGNPELRFTPGGIPIANFTVASTPRRFNRETNAWEDGDTLFARCNVWRDQAENVAASLAKGMRVLVVGTLVSRSFEDREGKTRTVWEIQVDEVGPSLRRARAQVTRVSAMAGNAA